jgi:tRNA pseudouridine38-40 synthase
VALEQRYRATVEYDGTDFLGYQVQARGRTVQGEIEKSLKQVTQAEIRIDGAGRTDAGVHATGQVIAFNTIWRHTLEDLQRALNALLPEDIIIRELSITKPSFHPRFEAISRTYYYQIINQPWPAVLLRRYAYHLNRPLDVAAMNQASRLLLGQHDFASFGKPPQGHNTVRTLSEAEWIAKEGQVTFRITANAFLYRMVRTIVGTLAQVGLGHLQIDDVKRILEAKDLTRSAPPVPAHGLCLVSVTYPEDV